MKLFISAERENGILRDFCRERSIELLAESMIGFEPVPNKVKHPFDVIFISSKRSFDYLSSLNIPFENKDFACIGKSTASYLNEQNSSTEFVGEKSGDPQSVARDFKEWLGERRVLFPVSDISHLTVANVIPEHQKEVVVCYRTIPSPKKIAECDIYVFTSPGNFESFLTLNSIPENAKIIAWGKTTERAIKSLKFIVSATLETASDEELIKKLI